MQAMVNIALKAARKAGDLIVRASSELDRLQVEEKSAHDYVSEVDRAAEREILFHLHKAHPNHPVLAEEGGLVAGREPADADYLWIIDPLDGTTNFLRGIPHYAVSIACLHKGRIEHAVVHDPVRDESFTASRGRGASLNGRRLRVSDRKTMAGALLGTGIPFGSRDADHIEAYSRAMGELAVQCAGIRRAGAASLDLAYVAAGRLDAFWEIGLQRWDTAAGILLVQEAGGLLADFNGGNQFFESGNIVCGTPKIFKTVLQSVNQHLGYLQAARSARQV